MPSSFTGRRRPRTTRPSVRVLDRAAGATITVGGLGTIGAVLGVCVFLAWVVLPLFGSAEARPVPGASHWAVPGDVVRVQPDEYRTMAWILDSVGRLRLHRLADGAVLREERLLGDSEPTAVSRGGLGPAVAFGMADGSVRLAELRYEAEYFETDTAPGALSDLSLGEAVVHAGGVAERTPEGQLRLQSLTAEVGPPVDAGATAPIVLIDFVESTTGPTFVTLHEDGALRLSRTRRRRNMLTGQVTLRSRVAELPPPPRRATAPSQLFLAGLGDDVLLLWPDGHLARYDTRDLDAPVLVEEVDVLPDGSEVTAATLLLGRFTLVVGDSTGGLSAWFDVKPPSAPTADGAVLTRAHVLPAARAAVTSLASSGRSRVLAVGDASGSVSLVQVTTEEELLRLEAPDSGAVRALAITPKEDGLVVLGADGVGSFDLDLAHPEVRFASLFRPVWYEGALRPEHVWQSSSGTDDFEMKLGLVPLIFGTMKATLYSLAFGAPLALLAAVYTSEFLRHPLKARVKSTIELMASLPSVVLGFLAALVVAPWVEGRVPVVLAALFTVPFSVAAGAHLWRFLPASLGVRWARWRLLAVMAALPVGIGAAVPLGPVLEDVLFAGNVVSWLDGQTGSAAAGWLLALLPASLLGTTWLVGRYWAPLLREWARVGAWSRQRVALVDAARFLTTVLCAFAFASLSSRLLSGLGLDARGWYVGTYVQRNALVVGFIMGFAIIPIIYTIAEDALTAVPEHLRSAALGCGATPWQAAVTVVIPTAMSGLFSALMIGLGRAVGETMIVLMAAGNTPVLDWNVFNGFRTLSANIAVELPEAVRGSTHYRTLFLAALTLFAMTFVVNTVAEVVRLRFRRRAQAA